MQNWFRRKELVSPPYHKCWIFAEKHLDFHAGDLIRSEHRQGRLSREARKLGASHGQTGSKCRNRAITPLGLRDMFDRPFGSAYFSGTPPFSVQPDKDPERTHVDRTRGQDLEAPQFGVIHRNRVGCPYRSCCRNEASEALRRANAEEMSLGISLSSFGD
jgi:hypothetical protein